MGYLSHVKFDTSGWRGIFCEDFTLDNVQVVGQAIADHLQNSEGMHFFLPSELLTRKFFCQLQAEAIYPII